MKSFFKDCLLIFSIVVLLFFASDLPSFSGTLKFVQLSDIHYSRSEKDTSYKLLSQTKPLLLDAIKQINSENNIDFVMVTGDGINNPRKDDFYALVNDLNTLKYPWYFSIGNHDTTTSGYLTKDNLVNILKEKNPNFTFNLPYYTFKPKKGYRVIVLDGAKNKGISSHGIITEIQLNWLDSILNKSKNDVVLVYIHFPIIPPFESKSHEILNVEEVKKIINKYKMPIAIFSGHYHATKITKRNNILHISTPALASYPNAFRIVEVNNKQKEVIFKFKFYETGLKDFQAKMKILTLGGAKYYGKERDRNTTITIEK